MPTTEVLARGPVAAPLVRWVGRVARACLAIGLTALAVLLLAPTAVGGSTSYVVTSGTSMLPTYRPGGLVLTRTAQDYRVGDVVAYRSGDLGGAVVMHRIVALRGDGYVFKGDNNDYLDRYVASESDLLGKAWVHLPGAGGVLSWLRSPAVFAVLLGAVTLVSLALPRRDQGHRRRRGR